MLRGVKPEKFFPVERFEELVHKERVPVGLFVHKGRERGRLRRVTVERICNKVVRGIPVEREEDDPVHGAAGAFYLHDRPVKFVHGFREPEGTEKEEVHIA